MTARVQQAHGHASSYRLPAVQQAVYSVEHGASAVFEEVDWVQAEAVKVRIVAVREAVDALVAEVVGLLDEVALAQSIVRDEANPSKIAVPPIQRECLGWLQCLNFRPCLNFRLCARRHGRAHDAERRRVRV